MKEYGKSLSCTLGNIVNFWMKIWWYVKILFGEQKNCCWEMDQENKCVKTVSGRFAGSIYWTWKTNKQVLLEFRKFTHFYIIEEEKLHIEKQTQNFLENKEEKSRSKVIQLRKSWENNFFSCFSHWII